MTVITPTIETREELLVEASASVQAQTVATFHFIGLDTEGYGPARMRSFLLDQVETPFVAFLDDDDLLDPEHVETLRGALRASRADLAYSYHRTEGATAPATPRPLNDRMMRSLLAGGRNCIPVTVVARTASVLAAGSFRGEDRYEDFELWRRMLARGARFELVPRVTWTYRFLGGNRTWIGSSIGSRA